jgi:porphobilinogen synthase
MDLTKRPRRLRRSAGLRALVRETHLAPDQLVYPLFVCEGTGVRRPVSSMPGVFQLSVDETVKEAQAARADGVLAVLLFGLPAAKDAEGSAAWDPQGPVPRAVRALVQAIPDLVVITDVCLCEYTEHGHCGVLEGERILNDPTVERLVRSAIVHAEAGAHVVAPSDMMDGRVGAIRQALDARGFDEVAILSYAVKYCSAFYGPFREAADSAPKFGDRRSHQMDPANGDEALREAALDVEEGADMVMVKPAVPYLDIVSRVKRELRVPTAAYHVSGEYSMLKAASANGWLDETRAMMETLIAIRRAGADVIVTYYARDAARLLRTPAR